MRSPYYAILLDKDENISDYVDDFVFEDCMEEDSMLEIRAYPKSGMAESLLNDHIKLDTGALLKFHFGFLKDMPSLNRIAVVKDVEARYNESGVQVTIRALSRGVDMKRSSSNKIWKNKTSAQIVEEIGGKYGLKLDIEDTSQVWKSLPQGNRSDMDFILYLASRETDGNFTTYVRDEVLYFVKRKVDSPSAATFTWGDGSGTMIAFEPKQKESTSSKGANSTSVSAYDLNKQKVTIANANNVNEKGETTLGNVKIKYNGTTGQKIGEFIEKTIVRPETGKTADNLANSRKKKGQLGLMEASMRIELNPHITPNSIITINGVADRYIGNWLVKKVRHQINSGGATSILELVKNGRKKGGDKATKKNTTTGPKTAEQKVKLIRYRGDTGERVN